MLTQIAFPIIRSVVYLWIGIESLLVAQLYYFGYKRVKPTKIIVAFQKLFAALGIMFILFAVLPILTISNHEFRDILINHGWVVWLSIPIGVSIKEIRKESIIGENEN